MIKSPAVLLCSTHPDWDMDHVVFIVSVSYIFFLAHHLVIVLVITLLQYCSICVQIILYLIMASNQMNDASNLDMPERRCELLPLGVNEKVPGCQKMCIEIT